MLGYWVPLALTVGVATISIAAWIWSERNDSEEDDEDRREDQLGDGDYPPVARLDTRADAPRTATHYRETQQDDGSMIARMNDAFRRAPSPQQIFGGASRRVAAGVAAAGALVGGALTSIREENRGDFEDHSRWSEEVRSRGNEQGPQPIPPAPAMSGALGRAPATFPSAIHKGKKIVAFVVSSEMLHAYQDDFSNDHVSIMSHLPERVNWDTTRIFVFIYAPRLEHTIGQGAPSRPTLSITSSYSNIGTEEAPLPGETTAGDLTAVEPQQGDEFEGTTPLFRTLYQQAQAVVEKETMIMPFSTPTGYVHLVRHISPDIVYVQESLTGRDGDAVHHIAGWVRQVVVVVGDEGGRGGLIDSEDESALGEVEGKWWQKESTTGIGKRIDVVDVHRTGDDWRRRVLGLD